MSEVVEVIEDVKEKIGDKGFFILMGGIALLFIYNMSKSSTSTDSTSAMVYASYPDATSNADVIISTLQDNIQYAQDEIQETLVETNKNIEEHFIETNGFISSGIASTADLSNKIDSVSGALSSKLDGISNTMSGINNTSGALSSKLDGISNTMSGINNTMSGISSTVSHISSGIDTQSLTLSAIQSQVNKTNATKDSMGALVNAVESSARNDDVSGGISQIFNVTRPTNALVNASDSNNGRVSETSSHSPHNDSLIPDKPLTHLFGELSMTSDIKR